MEHTIPTPEQGKEEWRERFTKTRLYKEGGSCFECSDYEGMVIDMEAFIASERALVAKETEERVQKTLDELYKPLGLYDPDDIFLDGYKAALSDVRARLQEPTSLTD